MALLAATLVATTATPPAHAGDRDPQVPAAPAADDAPETAGPTDGTDITDANNDGFIGRRRLALEVDSCKRADGLDDAELLALASEHYKRGSVLYEQADFIAAIEEFVAAYCHKPDFLMLKNIAQSYERQVDYERAVAYLERYILEAPDEAIREREQQSARLQMLANLPARLKVATTPPGATVTLTGTTGINARGTANDEQPILVRGGTYTMTLTLPGYEPIEETVQPQIGQPYSYFFRLEPSKGLLRVSTTPSDARIFVDKRLVAIGSHIESLPIGRYSVTVERQGQISTTRSVEIREDETTDLPIEMVPLPKSGRRQLIVATSAGGLILGAGAFATVFQDEPLLASIGALVGGGLGFAGSYYGVDNDISVGKSSYLIGMTFIGAAEGATSAALFACDHTEQANGEYTQTCDDKVIAGAGLAAGIVGAGVGTLTADRFRLDAGDVALINSGAIWGSLTGGLLFAVFDDPRLDAPLILGGLNLGIAASAILAQSQQMSRGHVALIDLSGLAGIIAGVAMVDVVSQGERSERLPHFALGGMAIGLISGAYLTRNIDAPKTLTLKPGVTTNTDSTGATTTMAFVRGSF